ncbi:MAG: hypothetical protein BYD32DRAFT_461633 [Podila humilis]|nr:MAG: hypothetical protein BYD32DRAFT_461633 [Podila humilis]
MSNGKRQNRVQDVQSSTPDVKRTRISNSTEPQMTHDARTTRVKGYDNEEDQDELLTRRPARHRVRRSYDGLLAEGGDDDSGCRFGASDNRRDSSQKHAPGGKNNPQKVQRTTTARAGSLPTKPSSPTTSSAPAIAVERQTLQDDDSMAVLNLIDCFTEHLDIGRRGTSRVPVLALCVRSETQIQVTPFPKIKTPVSIALRHMDHHSCAVGAVAFHLFDRFQACREDFPDFTNLKEWSKIKLIRGEDRLMEADFDKVARNITEVAQTVGIEHGFHGLCKVSARELLDLGLDDRWPIQIGPDSEILKAAALAGFFNTSYRLDRDCIPPPLDLQRMVFPIIEGLRGEETQAAWRKHCDEVMQNPSPPGPSTQPGAAKTRRLEALRDSRPKYREEAWRGFLDLLLWLRRVILQDAVMFMHDNSLNSVLRDPVFSTPEFEQFKTDLLASIEVLSSRRHVMFSVPETTSEEQGQTNEEVKNTQREQSQQEEESHRDEKKDPSTESLQSIGKDDDEMSDEDDEAQDQRRQQLVEKLQKLDQKWYNTKLERMSHKYEEEKLSLKRRIEQQEKDTTGLQLQVQGLSLQLESKEGLIRQLTEERDKLRSEGSKKQRPNSSQVESCDQHPAIKEE